MEVIDALREYLVKERLVSSDYNVDDEESLLDSGIIDSLAILELTTHIEQTYNVSVEEDELVPENFDTLSAMGSFINRKVLKNA